jgi:hypothetical protein
MDDRRWCAVVADLGAPGRPSEVLFGTYFSEIIYLFDVSFHATAATKQFSGAAKHPESVCGCLHVYAAAVEDPDLGSALPRGISETGVPTIETEWVPDAQAGMAPLFSLLGSHTRNALPCPDDPARGHLGAGNLLDLAGGASSVVDLDALPKPQVTNILLARNLLRRCRGNQREHGAAAKHQKRKHRKREAFDGRHLHDRRILSHLFCIFSPFGPTLICSPSGCFLVW